MDLDRWIPKEHIPGKKQEEKPALQAEDSSDRAPFNREEYFEVSMSLGDHLEELRARIILCLYTLFGALCMCMVDQKFYMDIVLLPHTKAMAALNMPATIQVLHYEESFFAHLKVSLIAALIFTMPFTIYQAWLFVSAGLYPEEKKYFYLFFPFAVICFIAGVFFGYFVLIPLGLKFLGGYGGSNIQIGFTLSSYISLFFALTFVCGLIFELPLIMLFLDKINVFKSQDYLKQWRYFVLTAFIIAAFLTPPDAVTQILMACPMVFLYFFGICLCILLERIQIIREFLMRP